MEAAYVQYCTCDMYDIHEGLSYITIIYKKNIHTVFRVGNEM